MGKSQCRPAVQLPTGMMHLLPACCPIEAKYKQQHGDVTPMLTCGTMHGCKAIARLIHHTLAAAAGQVRSAISKRQSSGRSRHGRRPWSG